jgi:hypothetical protein
MSDHAEGTLPQHRPSTNSDTSTPAASTPASFPDGFTLESAVAMIAQAMQTVSNKANTWNPSQSRATEPDPWASQPTLLFNGDDVTHFLREYEKRASYYGYSPKDKIERIKGYCASEVQEVLDYSTSIKYEESLENEDWAHLRRSMRSHWKSRDKAQLEESEAAFVHWLWECQLTQDLDMQEYLDRFSVKFGRCVEAATVRPEDKAFYVLKGLSTKTAVKILTRNNWSLDQRAGMEYEKILKFLNVKVREQYQERLLQPGKLVWTTPMNSQKPTEQRTQGMEERNKETTQNATKRPYGIPGMRAPPGSRPTQHEVEDLADRLKNMTLNRVTVQCWNPRESELLNDPSIRMEVEGLAGVNVAGAASHPTASQTQGAYREQSMQAQQPSYYNQGPQQAPAPQAQYHQPMRSQQASYQAAPMYVSATAGAPPMNGIGGGCFGCGGDHRDGVRACPERLRMIENGWFWYDYESRRLRWGEGPDASQGDKEIGSIGARFRQNEFLKSLVWQYWKKDPLESKAPWVGQQHPSQAQTSTAAYQVGASKVSSAALTIDESCGPGLLGKDDFDREWEELYVPLNSQAHRGRVAEVSSMALHCEQRSAQGDHRTQATVTPPEIRARKDGDDSFQVSRTSGKKVNFDDEDMRDVEDFEDAGLRKEFTAPKPRKAKQPKLADSFLGDTDRMMALILDSRMEVTMRDAISNMPAVKKALFKDNLTDEQSERLGLRNTPTGVERVEDEEVVGRYPRLSQVGGQGVPSYMSVEFKNGQLLRCGPYNPRSSQAPPLAYPTTSAIVARVQFGHNRQTVTTADRRALDEESGVEHMKRDCPKVLCRIQGARIQALLDTGAELNTIRMATAEGAGLQISSMPTSLQNVKLMTANGEHEEFQGIVFRAPVVVGEVTITTTLFVVKSLSSPVILGNPFLSDAKAEFAYDNDGQTYCKLHSEDGTCSTRFIATRPDPLNPKGMLYHKQGNGRET